MIFDNVFEFKQKEPSQQSFICCAAENYVLKIYAALQLLRYPCIKPPINEISINKIASAKWKIFAVFVIFLLFLGCTFWVFPAASEAIFRNSFHSEILKFQPQNAVQNGGWRKKARRHFFAKKMANEAAMLHFTVPSGTTSHLHAVPAALHWIIVTPCLLVPP